MSSKRFYPPVPSRRAAFNRLLLTIAANLIVWSALCVGYYFLFSSVFDTPLEKRAKKSTLLFESEYKKISARLDTLNQVLDNVSERDKNIFRILFEAEPYELDDSRDNMYDILLSSSKRELMHENVSRTNAFENNLSAARRTCDSLIELMQRPETGINNLPSIQPVINKQLTLLTASYGMRIHPFYKSLVSHQGVDYTVPEGSRVFATADGIVKEVVQRRASSGLSVVISHQNGYETSYAHLSSISVKKGERVHKGDIIATTGNSGLSLSPHLHYEIRYQGMRIDPIHYFFGELTPKEYHNMIRIAQSGMQSFD